MLIERSPRLREIGVRSLVAKDLSLFLGGFTVKRSATGVSEYQGSSKIINKCSVSQ